MVFELIKSERVKKNRKTEMANAKGLPNINIPIIKFSGSLIDQRSRNEYIKNIRYNP